jgi:hypothetical protein
MRNLVLSGFLLITFCASVWACPDLRGDFQRCESSNQTETDISRLSLTQQTAGGVTTYQVKTELRSDGTVTEETYVADGKTRRTVVTDPENQTTLKTEVTAQCLGQQLKINLKVAIDDQSVANVEVKVTKVGDKLIQVFKGTNLEEPINETVTCY